MTARSTDTITVERAQQGTSKIAITQNHFAMRVITKKDWEDVDAQIQSLQTTDTSYDSRLDALETNDGVQDTNIAANTSTGSTNAASITALETRATALEALNSTDQDDELTLASGAVTLPETAAPIMNVKIAPESGSTDDLDTISGADFVGQLCLVHPSTSSTTITAKDGTGNLNLAGDFAMDSVEDCLLLVWHGSWREVSRSSNA